VEMEFGTGALKVTPAHDAVDFAIGRDHGLDEPSVIGEDGRMDGSVTGLYDGWTQEDAAKAILDWCRERDLLEKRENYRHAVPVCERCESRIEPRVSLQWWCSMEELKKPAIAALRERRVVFHPESQHRFAIDSLESAPDWNISRQIWWGHQLPVWYCPDGHVTCVDTAPGACAECGSAELTRETDVLDTWFSSALWPFATLGWPDETPDLKTFYPGDLQTTAREIIRLWENRMIFSGLELLGEVPFTDVIIHTTVLAQDGRRMSKSLGTGIDPLELIDRYGADALRYGLLKMSSGQDVRFSEGAIEEGRKLANKLWNASRLLVMGGVGEIDARPSAIEERWIFARIDATRAEVEDDLQRNDFAHAVDRLYHLTFDDFCDWYLEAIKPRLAEPDARATAFAALERLLALLHPVMPHVTEEIWAQFHDTRLIVSPWPALDDRFAQDAGALTNAQTAARIYRRSGVRIKVPGDAQRIFEAVVRPTADGAGDVEAERVRVGKEIDRSERMLANEKFVANAAPDVVDAEREKLAQYRAELDALA
jgi:valyl-tRNA synthetase